MVVGAGDQRRPAVARVEQPDGGGSGRDRSPRSARPGRRRRSGNQRRIVHPASSVGPGGLFRPDERLSHVHEEDHLRRVAARDRHACLAAGAAPSHAAKIDGGADRDALRQPRSALRPLHGRGTCARASPGASLRTGRLLISEPSAAGRKPRPTASRRRRCSASPRCPRRSPRSPSSSCATRASSALDAPAETYVPELRGWRYPTSDSPRIRVRDLLNHVAGFVDDNPWGDRQQVLPDAEFTAHPEGRRAVRAAPAHCVGIFELRLRDARPDHHQCLRPALSGLYPRRDHAPARHGHRPATTSSPRRRERRAIGYRWENDAYAARARHEATAHSERWAASRPAPTIMPDGSPSCSRPGRRATGPRPGR